MTAAVQATNHCCFRTARCPTEWSNGCPTCTTSWICIGPLRMASSNNTWPSGCSRNACASRGMAKTIGAGPVATSRRMARSFSGVALFCWTSRTITKLLELEAKACNESVRGLKEKAARTSFCCCKAPRPDLGWGRSACQQKP